MPEKAPEKTTVFTKALTAVKVLSLFLIIIFFIPTSVVSCESASLEVKISPFDAALGIIEYDSDSPYYDELRSYGEDLPFHFDLFLIPVLVVLIFKNGLKKPIRSLLYSFLNIILITAMHCFYVEDTVTATEMGSMFTVETTAAFDTFITINVFFMLYFGAYILSKSAHSIHGFFYRQCECGAKVKLWETYCPNCGRLMDKESDPVNEQNVNNSVPNETNTLEKAPDDNNNRQN